jgi:hypothetical protein
MNQIDNSNKAIIYGVKSSKGFHYIGKTVTKPLNTGELRNSDVHRQYASQDIRNVFIVNDDIKVLTLKIVDVEDWYDEKLEEVQQKYKNDNPLLNAKWMLEGKRGYWSDTRGFWEGKSRDVFTLHRLSESKFKKVCQYDRQGKLVKIWSSGKEVGVKVFGDYKVINGAGTTALYDAWSSKTLSGKFKLNSLWYRESELQKTYGCVPQQLDLMAIYKAEQQRKDESHRIAMLTKHKNGMQMRLSVRQCDENGKTIKTFMSTEEAAYRLKMSVDAVRKICSGKHWCKEFKLQYGEKHREGLEISFPKYEYAKIEFHRVASKKRLAELREAIIEKCPDLPDEPREKKGYVFHRTRTTIEIFDSRTKETLRVFDDVQDASVKLGISEQRVRQMCKARLKNNTLHIRYGEKRQTFREQKVRAKQQQKLIKGNFGVPKWDKYRMRDK